MGPPPALLALPLMLGAALAGNAVGDAAVWGFLGEGWTATSPEFGVGCTPGAVANRGTVSLLLADRSAEDGLAIRFDLAGLLPCIARLSPATGDPAAGWSGRCVDVQYFCDWVLRPNPGGTYAFDLSASLGLQGWSLWAPALTMFPLDVPG